MLIFCDFIHVYVFTTNHHLKQETTFVLFLNENIICDPHLTIFFLYFLHALKMIHIATDRRGDNEVN